MDYLRARSDDTGASRFKHLKGAGCYVQDDPQPSGVQDQDYRGMGEVVQVHRLPG